MALPALALEFVKVSHNRFQHFSDKDAQKLNLVLYLLNFLVQFTFHQAPLSNLPGGGVL